MNGFPDTSSNASRRLFLLAFSATLLWSLPPSLASATGLTGEWQGSFKIVYTSDAHGSEELEKSGHRLVLRNGTAQVFLGDKEVKPGQFRIEQQTQSAIVFAINSGKDSEGTWIETWTYTITLKDNDTLIASLAWMVNNIDLPLDKDISKMSALATGEFRRIQH